MDRFLAIDGMHGMFAAQTSLEIDVEDLGLDEELQEVLRDLDILRALRNKAAGPPLLCRSYQR